MRTEKVIVTNDELPKPPKPLEAARKRFDRKLYKARAAKANKTKKEKRKTLSLTARGTPRIYAPRKKKPEPRARLVVHLNQRYVMGTRAYGPGTVEVSEDIGRCLQEMQSRSAAEEARLHQDRAFVIVAGNRAVEVDPASFDMTMGQMNPFAQVRG